MSRNAEGTPGAMAHETLRQQLLRAARGSVLIRIAALGLALATSIVLARALGPIAYGTYAYVFAIVTLLALPSQVGIPTLLIRETARSQAAGDWARMKGLWAWATRTILVTSVAVAAVAAVWLAWQGTRQDADLRMTLLAGMLLVPMVALGNARGAALNGLRLVVRGQLPESVARPLLLILLVGIAWLVAGPMQAHTAMALHVAAAALSFLLGAWLLWSSRPPGLAAAAADTRDAASWWRAALPLALISGLQVAGNQSGIILLGLLGSQVEVAEYKVATSAAALALFGLQTTTLILSPHVAREHALGDAARVQRLATLAAAVGVGLTLPALAFFVFAGEWIIRVLYGMSYAGAYWPLLILAVGQALNACFGMNAGLMSMTGHERAAARWLTVSAVLTVVLGVAMVPRLGMVGAALAYVVAMLVWNVAFWWIVKRRVGVDSSILAIFQPGALHALRSLRGGRQRHA